MITVIVNIKRCIFKYKVNKLEIQYNLQILVLMYQIGNALIHDRHMDEKVSYPDQ